MVLTLLQQGLGLRPREKRALCGKMCSCSLMAMKLCDLIVSEKTKVVHFSCDIKNTAHVLYAKADSVVLYSHITLK